MQGIKVVDPVLVRTENSWYRISPAMVNGEPGYSLSKIEDFVPSGHPYISVGCTKEGNALHLALNERIVLGSFSTTPVREIVYDEPDH